MRFLRKVVTHEEFDATNDSFKRPYVVLCEKHMHYLNKEKEIVEAESTWDNSSWNNFKWK